MLDIIDKMPLQLPINWESQAWVILMTLEHSRIHLETSSVLLRQLPDGAVVPGRFGHICDKRG